MDAVLRKLKKETLYRELTFDKDSIDSESRTVALAVSSEAPVERFFGIEILDHSSEESIDLSRFNDGAPLLFNHDPDQHIGVIENTQLDNDNKLRQVVRFSNSELGKEKFQDVVDRILTKVSIGYSLANAEVINEGQRDGKDVYRFKGWTGLETSMVTIPADQTVGVGRSHEQNQTETKILEKENTVKTEINLDSAREDAKRELQEENKRRMKEINDLVDFAADKGHDMRDLGRQYITEDRTAAEFRQAVLENVLNAKPVTSEPKPLAEIEKEEGRKYSIHTAIRNELSNQRGFEHEVSNYLAKETRKDPAGLLIPLQALSLHRSVLAEDATKGGYTVDEDVLGSQFIEQLKNETVIDKLGVRRLDGLVGNVAIPSKTGASTAYWLSETGEVTASDLTFSSITLNPHRLVALVGVSRQAIFQSSLGLESITREDMAEQINIARDLAYFQGDGASGEPIGLFNITGTGSVTFGTTATLAKAIEFETDVDTSNALRGNPMYVTTPTVKGAWKAIDEGTDTGIRLWRNNEVNGYGAMSSQHIPDNRVAFGNFADSIASSWDGVDVIVDPFSSKKTNLIELQMTIHVDQAFRHAASWSLSSDAGNQ
jgi:HK97 family phage major capsid protein